MIVYMWWSLHLMLKETTAHEGARWSKCDGAAEPSVGLNQKDTLDLNGHGPDWCYCSDCAECEASGWSVLTWDCMGGEMWKSLLVSWSLKEEEHNFLQRSQKHWNSWNCLIGGKVRAVIWLESEPLVFFKVDSRATKPTCVRDRYHPCPRGSSLSSKNKRSHRWKMFVVLRSQFEASIF